MCILLTQRLCANINGKNFYGWGFELRENIINLCKSCFFGIYRFHNVMYMADLVIRTCSYLSLSILGKLVMIGYLSSYFIFHGINLVVTSDLIAFYYSTM